MSAKHMAMSQTVGAMSCRTLDAVTGQEKWRSNNELSWVNSSPAVAEGNVFFATSDSSLFRAVDAAAGRELFHQQAKPHMFSSPAVAAVSSSLAY
jgi:outer membrane protein assembly factor BamB